MPGPEANQFKGNSLKQSDFLQLQAIGTTLLNRYGDGDILMGFLPQISSIKNYLKDPEAKGDQELNDEGKRALAEWIPKFTEAVDKHTNSVDAEKYPKAASLEAAELDHAKMILRMLSQGISLSSNRDIVPVADPIGTNAPNMGELYTPETLGKTEEALNVFPLHEFYQQGNDLLKSQWELGLGKGSMSAEQLEEKQEQYDKKQERMLESIKKFDERSKNPDEKAAFLFDGKISYLNGGTGFTGPRGLSRMQGNIQESLIRIDIPEMNDFGAALGRFNTKRASVFKQESDEHREMREAAEALQNKMKTLDDGFTIGEDGKKHILTQDEKDKLLQETYQSMKEMDQKTQAYIDHATKNGTKRPSTDAGKERLAGANQLKALSAKLKEKFAKEPAYESELNNDLSDSIEGMDRYNDMMGKEYRKLRSSSTTEFRGKKNGIDEWEYQLATVITMQSLKENAVKDGSVPNTSRVDLQAGRLANSKEFHEFAQGIMDEGKERELSDMVPAQIKNKFVKHVNKSMQQEKQHEQRKHAREKDAPNKQMKQEEPKMGKK